MSLPKVGDFELLPPAPGVCQTCAVDHAPAQPHNQQSLYFQYRFQADHGRWPTWEDAMAHCDEETQQAWREELTKRGVTFVPITRREDSPMRDLADRTLEQLGLEPRHVEATTAAQHGHPGVCCCLLASCAHRVCNVNVLLLALVADRGYPDPGAQSP